ncbi:FKBP-type peptidyl-prolyl cis-trans isomerase SlpA [uncultured Thiomicrorhabdus sp.]
MSKPLARVHENSEISLVFKMELPDGTLVEEATDNEPFRFRLGEGEFLDKLEDMLVGLEVGTTAKLTLSPERAFGASNPENVHEMPLTSFPAEMPPEKGQVIGFNTPTGQEVPGTIVEVKADTAVVDFNHPLADATIILTAKIAEIH